MSRKYPPGYNMHDVYAKRLVAGGLTAAILASGVAVGGVVYNHTHGTEQQQEQRQSVLHPQQFGGYPWKPGQGYRP